MEDPVNSPPMASSGYSILPSSQYGFMELLGLQDSSPYQYDGNTSLLNGILPLHQAPPVMFSAAAEPFPKVADQPATPNGSSSISSSTSTEAAAATDAEVQIKVADEVREEEEDEEEDQRTQKK